MIEAGTQAPDFTLQSDTGETVTLSQLRGKPVVLYFYPKDDTPGCTTEACEFRDAFPRFDQSGAVILGVSPDDVESHQAFRAKFDLPFPLLADTEHAVAEQYGAWQEKNMYGKRFWGIQRSTFVIGADGVVAKVFKRVKAAGHAEKVADAIGELGAR